jgi:hypothetical protein
MKNSTSAIYDYKSIVPERRAKQKEKIKRRPMSDAIREELSKRTKDEAVKATPTNKETAVRMMTVCSRLPMDFIIDEFIKTEVTEPGPAGVRTVPV